MVYVENQSVTSIQATLVIELNRLGQVHWYKDSAEGTMVIWLWFGWLKLYRSCSVYQEWTSRRAASVHMMASLSCHIQCTFYLFIFALVCNFVSVTQCTLFYRFYYYFFGEVLVSNQMNTRVFLVDYFNFFLQFCENNFDNAINSTDIDTLIKG